VLACTHYPLLIDRYTQLAPWAVKWIDPAPAIARRVVELLGPGNGDESGVSTRAIFTSGRALSPALRTTLADFGLRDIGALEAFDRPVLSA
jgi:glutamate racemase